MNAPSPLFAITLAKPLQPRLPDGGVIAHASIVQLDGGIDLRLADEASVHTIKLITHGVAAQVLVEWPDGTLATAYLPPGKQVLEGMRAALLEAYQRGREVLERIHSAHGQLTDNA